MKIRKDRQESDCLVKSKTKLNFIEKVWDNREKSFS